MSDPLADEQIAWGLKLPRDAIFGADFVHAALRELQALRAEVERLRQPHREPPMTPEQWAEAERRFRERFPNAGPGSYGTMDFQKIDLRDENDSKETDHA